MQRFVRPQWNLALRDMANPGHAIGTRWPANPTVPGVAPMTAPRRLTGLCGRRVRSQRGHFLVEQFLDVQQPSGIKDRINFHLGIDLQLRVPLSVDDVDRAQRATFLALLTDRRTLLISAPFSRGVMFVSQRHQTTGFGAATISN